MTSCLVLWKADGAKSLSMEQVEFDHVNMNYLSTLTRQHTEANEIVVFEAIFAYGTWWYIGLYIYKHQTSCLFLKHVVMVYWYAGMQTS